MKYYILVDYFMYSDEKGDYTEPLYLGVEGEHKIFVFDKEVSARTKIFTSAKEAGEYVDKHFSDMPMSYENLRIVQDTSDAEFMLIGEEK